MTELDGSVPPGTDPFTEIATGDELEIRAFTPAEMAEMMGLSVEEVQQFWRYILDRLNAPAVGEARLIAEFEDGRLVGEPKVLAECYEVPGKLPQVAAKRIERLSEVFDLAATFTNEVCDEIEPWIEPETGTTTGRPLTEVTTSQRQQIFKLRYTKNGRKRGPHAIAKEVKPPLGWRVVQRVINEYEAT